MGDSIYFYNPSLAASILFTILYTLPLFYHTYLSLIAPYTGHQKKVPYFIPIAIGAATEVAAYAIRAASVHQQDNIGLYATSSSLIVIAPVLVCASLYILIGRLIRSSGGRATPSSDTETKEAVRLFGRFSPAWIPRVFVTSDVVSFLTQAAGSGIASSNDWVGKEKDVGVGVLIAGLVLQLVTFGFFLGVVVWFDRCSSGEVEEGVRSVLRGIYVAGVFIMIRLIYRVVEFCMGMDTYTWTHEWPLYVLEAVPMLIAMMVLGWYHPARWLPTGFGAREK
ncbi:putative RTA1 domain protein [Aspergillus novoparasiticus]|uniref:Putative RTA1 domain protein n=1 Tax=Aspergillus novoparasiticus TaxID=986946 RepID=A0A5N6F7B5_9EURO|nr:putative RTA1 domain protein [Aspergillus novoparasiticus]